MKSLIVIVIVVLGGYYAVSQLMQDQQLPTGEQVGDAFETAGAAEYNVSRGMRDRMNGR